MKKSVLIICLVLIGLSTSAATKDSGKDKFKYPAVAEEVSNPESFLPRHIRTLEESISEDNKVIDGIVPDPEPVCARGKSIEETIAENNKIIDSNIDDSYRPLNFKKINARLGHNNTVRKGF